jgi:hypothetical protein
VHEHVVYEFVGRRTKDLHEDDGDVLAGELVGFADVRDLQHAGDLRQRGSVPAALGRRG